jgi:outer membrane receptor protein involved in Fe transport
MRYNLGFNARPSFLSNDYVHLQQKIRNNTFNYSPNINLSKIFSPSKTLSFNYSGNNQNPSISQLQPIRNVQNLQNILEGNPNLKPSFSHNMNARFNYSVVKSGISVQSGLNFSTTQREIVNNIILIPDTLNSLKQITRFENINGNYNVGGNYSVHVPFQKNKYAIGYSGTVSFSNRASFINNERAYNKGFNFSQNIRGSITHKKFNLNTNVSYNVTNNNGTSSLNSYSDFIAVGLGQITNATFFKSTTFRADMNSSLRLKKFTLNGGASYNATNSENSENNTSIGDVKTISLNLSGTLTIKKSYFINFSSSKRINSGYAFNNNNPFLLNAGLRKNFMKDGALSLNLSGNDLLNQGNNINRYITGNTVVDSRTNQVTRVFSLALSYNISRFGGRNFRVDAD